MTQIALIVLINISFLLYGIKYMPSNSRLNNIELIFFDLILLVANISAFIIGIIDDAENEHTKALGNVIIGCFFAFTVFSLSFLFIQFSFGIISVIKEIKEARRTK